MTMVDAMQDNSVVPTGILTINISAIVDNWRQLASMTPTACGAVVKANAYGLGVTKVAPALAEAGCQQFYVVTLSEAIELRQCLPEATIVLLGGLSHSTPQDCVTYHLMPVLFSNVAVDQWLEFIGTQSTSIRPVLKVDTGMHRLGIPWRDFIGWVEDKPEQLKQILPSVIMSHLACADIPSHDLNDRQLKRFQAVREAVQRSGIELSYSLANSSGLFLGQDYHFDFQRPGSALYGINPTPAKPNPMKQVVSLRLPVLQVKLIRQGDTVGYGADYVASSDTRIAIVFGGYADGLPRCLTGAKVSVGDHKVPIIGRLSMDSFVVDITSLDSAFTPEQVEVFPDVSSLDQLAAEANTIGYELLTRLGRRYRRSYV